MSHYGMISLNGIELYGLNNAVNYHMLRLFSPNDYVEKTILGEDGDLISVKGFVTTCRMVKKRLDIIGYSLDRALAEFEYNIAFLSSDDDCPSEMHDIMGRIYNYSVVNSNYDLIRNMTLDNFNSAVKSLFKNPSAKIPTGNIVLDYIINHIKSGYYGLGFSVFDPLTEARMILENLEEASEVIYDLSQLIDIGYVEVEDILSFWGEIGFSEIADKTIILTEGTTDIYVLRKSLDLLYPEFSHLYRFFDFDNAGSSGSTSSLVNLLKGFINAGIQERIIALFDNDTAAYEALSSFDRDKLTKNIRIMHLPNLDWAVQYPTLGPTGEVKIDINGLACSIELFMGKNLLIKNDKFIPIQWKGYSSKLHRYQGEILYKKDIYDSFCNIIKKVENNGLESIEHDWEQLKYLWEKLFIAFNC